MPKVKVDLKIRLLYFNYLYNNGEIEKDKKIR